jgi:predicted nucleic acid-binding protein
MTGRVFLDTNVVAYAHDSSDPEKQKQAQQILRDGMVSGRVCISAQVLGELFVVLTRKIANPMGVDEAAQIVQAVSKLEVVEVGLVTVRLALHFVRLGGISYWDSLIVAAAKLAGCSTLYTEDLSHGRIIDSVTVENPFLAL